VPIVGRWSPPHSSKLSPLACSPSLSDPACTLNQAASGTGNSRSVDSNICFLQPLAFIESLGLRPLDVDGLKMAHWLEGMGLVTGGLAGNGVGHWDFALGANQFTG
jgi:hypothetical protein